jgi:antitoxin VapB
MALNIKNAEVESLAEDLARLSNTSKTEAIRQALLERRARIGLVGGLNNREGRLRRFLELRVWPTIPVDARWPWSREEEEAALGYGEFGEPV